jgi:hypothetical protein
VPLDKRERATLHLIGTIDGEVKMRLTAEIGKRDAERLCLTMRLDGCGNADDAKAIANATSNLVNHQR